jgi:PIN domain nuclease of toxin-antitoxin system
MRVLLDTHVLLWAVLQSRRLNSDVVALLEDPINDVYFSAASIWEVAIKYGRGKPEFDIPPAEIDKGARLVGFAELPVKAAVATRVAALPHHHRDPFDRLLIAQAEAHGLTLYTADPWLPHYGAFVRLLT